MRPADLAARSRLDRWFFCTATPIIRGNQIAKTFAHSDSLVILKKPFDNVEVLQLAQAM